MQHMVAGRLSACSLEALGYRAWPAAHIGQLASVSQTSSIGVLKPDGRLLLVASKESHHQIPMVCGMVFLGAASPGGDRLPDTSPPRRGAAN